MGASEKYSRYRWKEGREKDLWMFVDNRVKSGVSVTAALKEYGKKHDMSWLTARWKYYQIRKQGLVPADSPKDGPAALQEAASPALPAIPTTGPFTRDEEDFLGYLAEFITSSRDTGQDVIPFIKGLSRLAALSREGTKLRAEVERSRSSVREGAQALADICRFLKDWLNLPQVDRVGSLKGFSQRLETEVQRLGDLRDRLADA